MFPNKTISKTSLLFVFILFCFFAFKVKRFIDLNYTYDDMFSFLQMSNSWIDGRPFLAENVSYTNALNHNHYGVLLWFELTYFWGAYGLFMQQLLLLTISYVMLCEYVFPNLKISLQLSFSLTFLFGGLWLWINDHPSVGWCMELGYFPMAILFVIGYFYNKPYLLFLTGIYTILIKEDGAVMGFCVHFVCYGVKNFAAGKTIKALLLKRNTWLIICFWLTIFGFGMWFLSYKNSLFGSEVRVNKAFSNLALPIDILIYRYVQTLTKLLLLLSPLIVFIIFIVQKSGTTRKYQYYLLLSFVLLVNLFVISVQAIFHITESLEFFELLGLLFPPRTIQPYAILTAFCTSYLICFGPSLASITTKKSYLFILLTFWQFLIVSAVVHFNIYTTVTDLIRGNSMVKTQNFAFGKDELSFVKVLDSQIPLRSEVFVMDFYMPVFHRHYVVWPSGNHYKDADIAIIPKEDKQHLKNYLDKMHNQYDKISFGKLDIYFTKSYKPYIDKSRVIYGKNVF